VFKYQLSETAEEINLIRDMWRVLELYLEDLMVAFSRFLRKLDQIIEFLPLLR